MRVGHAKRPAVCADFKALGRGAGKLSQAPGSECSLPESRNRQVSFFFFLFFPFPMAAQRERRFGKGLKTSDFRSRLGKLHNSKGSGDS